MNDVKYPIEISPANGQGIPFISADFGRITVLLGSNGTGKSRALKIIRGMSSSFGEANRPQVYIEGGRVIAPPTMLTYDYNTYAEFGTYDKAKQTYKNRRLSPLVQRNKDVFYLLERRSESQKVRHSEAVSSWQATGSVGSCPAIEDDPLQRLFALFTEVFPEISIHVEGEIKNLMCVKAGQPYSITELSDGERQVLYILADIALSAEPNSLIIADEPELNLNPQLASRLWDTIEGTLPASIFIYATHNVSFALRTSVDRIVALSGHGAPAITIQSVNDLNSDDARELLGAIPAILAAPAALGIEGIDSSYDRDFYTWLLDRKDLAIVSLGGCQDVISATTRRGIWEQLAPSVKLVGVIDRDYRSDKSLAEYGRDCLVLNYHEAESYLCHPTVVVAVATALGTIGQIPNESIIVDKIVEYYNANLFRIVVSRMADRAYIRLNVSLEAAKFKSMTDAVALRALIGAEADQEAAKASASIGSGSATTIFDEELASCQEAVAQRDVEKLLRLCPGKELLYRLAPMAGCKDPASFARAVYKHLSPDSITAHAALKSELLSKL